MSYCNLGARSPRLSGKYLVYFDLFQFMWARISFCNLFFIQTAHVSYTIIHFTGTILHHHTCLPIKRLCAEIIIIKARAHISNHFLLVPSCMYVCIYLCKNNVSKLIEKICWRSIRSRVCVTKRSYPRLTILILFANRFRNVFNDLSDVCVCVCVFSTRVCPPPPPSHRECVHILLIP